MVDGERVERVQFAVDYIENRAKELGCENIISEKRVNPASLVGRDDMAGTVDIQLITPDVIEIIDYKGGMNPTDAIEQLEQYAVGAIADMPHRPLYIRMTVIQPKLRQRGMNPITTKEITLGELLEIKDVMIAQAAATDAPDAPHTPGEKQCKYCSHKGSCTALTTQAMGAAGIVFANLDVAKEAANKDPHTMDDKQLREIVESAPLIRGLLDAAEEEALKRMKAGKPVEGLKLVRGRGSNSWIVEEADLAEKLKKMGVPKDVIWPAKIISPAQIKKAQWEVTRAGVKEMKSLSERQMKVINEEYIKKSDGALTVASLSDPRNAVIMDAAPLFTAVDALPSWLS